MLLNIAIVVFAAVFCAVIAVIYISQNRFSWKVRATKKRLGELSEAQIQDGQNMSILRQEEKLSSIPAVDRWLKGFAFGEHLKRMIVQSGSETNPGVILLASGSLFALTFLLVHLVSHSLLLSALIAPAPAFVPYIWLVQKRAKRIRDFEEQLPEALDMIVNALRSGFTFELAMKLVAQEIPEPLGYEFAVVFEEQNLGVTLADALAGMRYRVPSDDLDILIISLVLNRRMGGNLAEVLEKAASTIRDRFRLKREVRTKSAHGRFSGFVLVLMPIFMGVILAVMSPDYASMLLVDEVGQILLATAIVMQIVGIFVIRKIIDIKI